MSAQLADVTPPLRGWRYADKDNGWLQRFLVDELPYLDFEETMAWYKRWQTIRQKRPRDWALHNCNDRFFLLTASLGRRDAFRQWLFDRCREVERDPDDHLDLWARDHYKSTIITYSGAIQEILIDPEITIGLFSFNQKIARKFVQQVKREFEVNEWLKRCHDDCLFADPKKEATLWTDSGFIVKRQTNPKEGTLEGWGLVTGQPTSKHYALRIYDDVVTRESVTNPEMVKKVTEAYELSDNLGGREQRKWIIGTRYSFADTYGVILAGGVVKPRVYAATDNGRANGNPVFLSPAMWEKKKREQPTQIAAQMLQNPLAGADQTFSPAWMRGYMIRPRTLTVYIMADPSKGTSAKSDRTAMAVIGIDSAGNKYLLDGYRHRMKLSEKWENLKGLYLKWRAVRGVQMVDVGYERYGMQSDDEYFQERMLLEGFSFPIRELSWTREGNESKKARVERLQPDLMNSRLFLPGLVWQAGSPQNLWSMNTDKSVMELRPLQAPTKLMEQLKAAGEEYRIPYPIVRKDEEGKLYDLTREFISEALFFPYGTHDDLVDAASRIYDMDALPPVAGESDAALEAREVAFPDA